MEEKRNIERETLIKVLDLAYNSIKLLLNATNEIKKDGLEKLPIVMKERLDVMNNVIVLINDIVSPAHEASKGWLKESEHPFIDYLIEVAKKSKEIEEEMKKNEKKEDKAS